MNAKQKVMIVRQVGECFIGFDLIRADQAIDEMRRFVYALRFSGAAQETVIGQLKTSEAVLKSVSVVAALSIAEVEEVAFELRYHLWVGSFARCPDSAFAQQYLSHGEAVPKAPRKKAAAKRRKGPPKLTVLPGGRLN